MDALKKNKKGYWEAEFINNIVMKAGFWAGSAGREGQNPDELILGHNIRADARQYDDPDSADDHLGFRIVIDYIIKK